VAREHSRGLRSELKLKNERAMRKERQICSSVEIKSHFCLQGSQGDYELFMSLQTRSGWRVKMARS
jgi:hypothetical protein